MSFTRILPYTIFSVAIWTNQLQAQVLQLWESPVTFGEKGLVYAAVDGSYPYIYVLDTIAAQCRLYSTLNHSLVYTLGVGSSEYPFYLLPDINGNGHPEIFFQDYSLPSYSVRLRDASSGQILQSWTGGTDSYYLWSVYAPTGSPVLRTMIQKTNVETFSSSVLVYSLGVSADVSDTETGREPFFRLNNNYPNPFNPETRISYEMSERGSVRVEVFSATGQIVRTFDEQTQDAGTHHVVWNGRTDLGAHATSGTYFYRVVANGISSTKKMILLR